MDYTLYEYESVTYQDLKLSPSHDLIDHIEALNLQHGKTLVEVGRHGLRATHFVGVLYSPHGTLTLLPKIDHGTDGERGALQNLVTMLCYAYDIRLIHPQQTALQTGRGGWLELLTGLFCDLLIRELQHGIERVYIETDERSPALKGRWLVGQQLANSPHLRHAFDIRHDDFSADTPLNQVLVSVATMLTQTARLPENRRRLREIQMMLGEVTIPPQITPKDLKAVLFTRLNERFKPAFQLARLFIESMTQVLRRGHAPLFAFVFDMNTLFESFVAKFLARHWRDIAGQAHRDITIQSQMTGDSPVYLAQDSTGNSLFKLIPDLLLRDKGRQPRLIIDTKYKRLVSGMREVSEADLYQMLAYAGRLGCSHILLLYPAMTSGGLSERFTTHQTGVQIEIRTLNLHQPLNDTRTLIGEFRSIFAPYLSHD